MKAIRLSQIDSEIKQVEQEINRVMIDLSLLTWVAAFYLLAVQMNWIG